MPRFKDIIKYGIDNIYQMFISGINNAVDNTSEITDEEDLHTDIRSDKTFETAPDTLKSISPSHDFSKSEVHESLNTNTGDLDSNVLPIATESSSNDTKDILSSQPARVPSLTPLDFSEPNICPSTNNTVCVSSSVHTNQILHPSVQSTALHKPSNVNSAHLGTPSTAGTPKTPSPRLSSLLRFAGYSSQDIHDASSPVSNSPQIKNHQETPADVKTPPESGSKSNLVPVSSPITLTSSNFNKNDNNQHNQLAFCQKV